MLLQMLKSCIEDYTVNGRALRSVVEQRNQEVQVHSSMTVATQIDRVVKKVFAMLALTGQGIEHRSWDIMLSCVRYWEDHIWSMDTVLVSRLQERCHLTGKDAHKQLKGRCRVCRFEL